MPVALKEPAAEPRMAGQMASNPFTAELGLLTKLVAPKISHAKDGASLPAPPKVKDMPGRKRQSVPPLTEQEVAIGESQTLQNHGKMMPAVSSTNHAGMKEMLIARKARHENAIEAFKKRMGSMEVELEARTGAVARSFKALMVLNDAELKSMFDELADDFLLQMEMDEVDSAWVRIDEELTRRRGWVDQFERDLTKVENERREMVEAELTTLLELLVATAHLLPPALERFVETETHSVNLLILANREVHAELLAKLRVEDVKRHKSSLREWEARKLEWRRLRHENALQTLKSYLHSPEVLAPQSQRLLLSELASKQQSFNERRFSVLVQLGKLRPPELSEAAANRSREELELLDADEEASARASHDALQQAEAAVAAEVAEACKYLRARLYHFAHLEPQALEAVIAAQVVPLVDLRAEQAQDLLERVEAAEATQRLRLHEDALQLVKRFEMAGRLFDEHVRRTSELYETLRDELHTCREEHEEADKANEMQLEKVLTDMRRAADKNELMLKQEEAMELLAQIQMGYRNFHRASLDIAEQHPNLMRAELTSVHTQLIEYHQLVSNEQEGEEEEGEGEEDAEPAAASVAAPDGAPPGAPDGAPPPLMNEDQDLSGTKVLDDGEQNLWATFGFQFDEKMEAQLALEDEQAGLDAANRNDPPPDPYLLETREGAKYRMRTDLEVAEAAMAVVRAKAAAEAEAAAAAVAAAEAEAAAAAAAADPKGKKGAPPPPPAETAPQPPAAEEAEPPPELPTLSAAEKISQLIPASYDGTPVLMPLTSWSSLPQDIETRVKLACECLNYQDAHAVAMSKRARHECGVLVKQLTRELDERLMSHQPRAGAVETDMAAERDQELLAHRERFVRHVKSVTSRRGMLSAALETKLETVIKAEKQHKDKLGALLRALGSEKNNHSATLNRLSREAEALHAAYTRVTQEMFDELEAASKAQLKEVLGVNTKFRDSWVLFSEGGIFNPIEQARFKERLAKVDEDAKAEAASQAERLAALREAQLQRAQEGQEGFRASFAVNKEDIVHIEQLKMQSGKCTADVRIVLAESAAQEAALDAQTEELSRLVKSVTRPGESEADNAEFDTDAARAAAQAKLASAILEASEDMRAKLLHRALFLDMLASEGMPKVAPKVSLDPPDPSTRPPPPPPPPPDPKAKKGAEPPPPPPAPDPNEPEMCEEAKPPTPLKELVAAARAKHEGLMIAMCAKYHQERGERPITRPSLIPENAELEADKVRARLDQMVHKAHDDWYHAGKTLRKQLLVIWRVLNSVGPSVFDDLSRACRKAAYNGCRTLLKAYAPLAKDRAAKRQLHESSLKPTMRNAGAQAELRALAMAEADRSAAEVSAATELRDALLAIETEQAQVLERRLVFLSGSILKLLDAELTDDDLIPNDDPPPDIHHGVKKKLRMETREMFPHPGQPQAGRPFYTYTWPGLPLGELTPDTCETRAVGADAPPESKEAIPRSLELQANQTRAQRSVITARDRVYESYRLYYAGRVREIRTACDAALTEARRWEAGWLKLVDHMEIKPPQ